MEWRERGASAQTSGVGDGDGGECNDKRIGLDP
jgi:hypothetical protein